MRCEQFSLSILPEPFPKAAPFNPLLILFIFYNFNKSKVE